MHWPVAAIPGKSTKEEYVETWHAMEKLLDTGKVKNIGVCNFSPAQLNDLIALSATKPAVHQMELHLYLQQTEWVQWHQSHGIHVTAYSPLGNSNPTYGPPSLLDPPALLKNPLIEDIAKERGCTPATVALAWGLGRGTSVIPKSAHVERIEENFGAIDCELQYEDLKALTEMGRKSLTRFNNPSKGWKVGLYEGLDGA